MKEKLKKIKELVSRECEKRGLIGGWKRVAVWF